MPRRVFIIAFSLSLPFLAAFAQEESNGSSRASAVIREMNLARENPQTYAAHLEALRATFNGSSITLPNGVRIRTHEGTRAVDEAIRFLRHSQPLGPLVMSSGMSRAAADHCAEQAGGGFGHGNPAARLARHGTCAGGWAENISYGKSSARDVVLALIVDDGQPARKHRQNIFNPTYSCAGAAFGSHAKFGSMCTIEFAGGYAERGQSIDAPLIAKNL
ncbi:MAG: CAP domain-containing protein [Chthoniobacterales bacterium]|jgi:uncharacterized protein YkwD